MILGLYFNVCVGATNLLLMKALKMSNKKPVIKNEEAFDMAQDMTDNLDGKSFKLLGLIIDLMYFVPVLNLLLSIATIKMYIDCFRNK